ncbi:hypothetical protein [Salipaludibacillus agaradhaerens]|uniref:hypothetical protein n=1 Tax=Salipaludibacillus agaradhaerens TaxID=76935 RepID=UPI00117DDE32|nr:hypothetical protein [Salipaludibacillus agaradhaerens]
MFITRDYLYTVLGILCYTASLVYLAAHIFPHPLLMTIYSLLGGCLLFFSFISITLLNRLIIGILFIAGTIVFITNDVPYLEMLYGFGQNLNLLSLFLLVPLIGTYMSTAGYLSALKQKVQQAEKRGVEHPYRLSYFLVATIGALLNFGALAIVKRIADESFHSFRERKLTLHMMRAFAFCMLWSPYFVNVALVLVLFDVSWFGIGGYGFLLAIIYGLISMIMLRYISFSEDPLMEIEERKSDVTYRPPASFASLLIFSCSFVACSFIFYRLANINMLTIVCLLAIGHPLIWAIFTKITRSYLHDVATQIQGSFVRLKNEIAVFITAGYFGLAISYTDLGDVVSTFIHTVSLGHVYLFTVFIMLIALLLAQIGIHPIIIVIGIGSSLSPEMFGVSPEYAALTLLLAWTMATQLSPFSGQMLMAAKLMKAPRSHIIRQNASFIVICFFVLSSVLFSFHLLGWV